MADESRIASARLSLVEMLEVEGLQHESFLDIGSGSGLFSLAAAGLNAARIHSFDYDEQSIACTLVLKQQFMPQAHHWTAEGGSILDTKYVKGLGQWDVVYSWGVLHHTGDMWRALANVVPLLALDGILFVSIYDDQGFRSELWRIVKRFYYTGWTARMATLAILIPCYVIVLGLVDLLRFTNPVERYLAYRKLRGMSTLHDWVDCIGGYPFEVVRPDEVIQFYCRRGFDLKGLVTCGNKTGCNQFVFRKL